MGALNVRLVSDAEAVAGGLRELGTTGIPQRRELLMRRAVTFGLTRTVEHTPVREARARGSWVGSLEALGGSPPSGWEGSRGNGGAILEGRSQRSLSQESDLDRTEYRVSSFVRYINYLEYGTRKMDPFEMVRQSLAETAAVLGGWSFLGGG